MMHWHRRKKVGSLTERMERRVKKVIREILEKLPM